MMDWNVLFPDLLETYGIPASTSHLEDRHVFRRDTTGLLYALWGHTEQPASGADMKDWKWAQDPKALLWIIGALVFLIWVVLQRP